MTTSSELKGKKIAVIENGLISTYTMREGLMLRLLKEGCDVYILTHTNSFSPQVEKMGLKVINVGSGNYNPFRVLRYIYDLRKALKKINPDICLTFSINVWIVFFSGFSIITFYYVQHLLLAELPSFISVCI